jgi:phage terminase large subunit GpA-like protein
LSWSEVEKAWRSSWKPPEKYTPSDWAERNYVLPVHGNAEPGKFRFSRTPYLRGIVDAVVEPGVEDVVFLKPTRVGGTTAGQIILGYWIDNDPGHCLTVLPSEAAAEQEIKERVRPMLDACPSLRQHVSANTHDNTLSVIKLDTMTLYVGWAGSPQSLASNTCRYCRFDEVDKYPPFAGRESDPISLGKERTATYLHRKRHYITSTPTTREGAIWRAWEACGDKRRYHVPCPHCGVYQTLAWAQVKWVKLDIADKVKLADEIERARLAWYECGNPNCKGRIEESHKPKMLESGVWASEGQTVERDGTTSGPRPASKRVGFHLSSLYSPWRTFAEMAAEFIRADGDTAAQMNFRNSRLAEPFELLVNKTEPGAIRTKAKDGPPARQVPAWAKVIIATADTQQDHFWYVVRAWGYEYRSRLLEYGAVSTFEELTRVLDTAFQIESGGVASPSILLIDSGGNRTNEVYQYARSDPGRVIPIKGSSERLNWPVGKSPQKDHGLVLWRLDTDHLKDHLTRLIHDADATRWQVHKEVNDDYCQQMSSEHKVIDPKTKRHEWKEKSSGTANHLWDCETYQCAAAYDLGCGDAEPGPEPQAVAPDAQPASSWATGRGWSVSPGGWNVKPWGTR